MEGTLSFSICDNENNYPLKITHFNNVYILDYPCPTSHECSAYKVELPPAKYFLELYGASGSSDRGATSYRYANNTFMDSTIVEYYGGNAVPGTTDHGSYAGAGGYTSGVLKLLVRTTMYMHIGGKGGVIKGACVDQKKCEEDQYRPPGGYNGGGRGLPYQQANAYSGGGATDIRAEENDVFHRIMVAGGGGGSDNNDIYNLGADDDGSGGAGGGLTAQGYFVNGVLDDKIVAGQLNGFAFGQGESALYGVSNHPNGSHANIGHSDRAGGGGGWFGGFSSHHGNGGGGGGSSFALTRDAEFPRGTIKLYNDVYMETGISGEYSFQNNEYIIDHPTFVSGIWEGNGKVVITIIDPFYSMQQCTNNCVKQSFYLSILLYYVIISI